MENIFLFKSKMGRQRGQTTQVERELIIFHLKEEKSYREISKIVSRSRFTVQYIIHSYKNGKGIANKKKISRRNFFNEY